MNSNQSTLSFINANIEFPLYCWTWWTGGLSEEGKKAKAGIEGMMKAGELTFPQAVEQVKEAVRNGEAENYHDWPERAPRVSQLLEQINPLADAILFQEVSYKEGDEYASNFKSCRSTAGNIIGELPYNVASYSPFGIMYKDETNDDMEKAMQRGNAVILNEKHKIESTEKFEYTIDSDKKTQTRSAEITTFKTNVLSEELLVKAVSVQIKGYNPRAYSKWNALDQKIKKLKAEGKEPDAKTLKDYSKAEKAYKEFKTSYEEGQSELKYYLDKLNEDMTSDVIVLGGDFNFDPLSGDGVLESGLQPRTNCNGVQGLLQDYGFETDKTQTEPTEKKRKLDYAAVKLSDRVRKLLKVEIKSTLLAPKADGYISDHRFVKTDITFSNISSL